MKNKLDGWFPREQSAAAFGVTLRQWDAKYAALAPAADAKLVKGRRFYRIRAIINAYIAAEVEKDKNASADPLLAGGDSPALEEYRRHRARLAQLDVQQREAALVPVSELDPMLQQLASLVRRATDTIRRQFGNEAGTIIEEAINEAQAGWEKLLAKPGDGTAQKK